MKTTTFLFAALLLCAPAAAQTDALVVNETGFVGARTAIIFADGFESGDVSRFDMNGDGTIDLILQRDDEEGILQSLRILDGRTREVLWHVPDLDGAGLPVKSLCHNEPVSTEVFRLWGFADPDADDEREAVFLCENEGALQAIILINPSDNTSSWEYVPDFPFRLLGVTDLTSDGSEDIILYIPQARTLQIWGDPHVDEP